MEYFDIYNDKWEKTGRTAARETRLQKGDYLLAADICLVNSEDCFLLQLLQVFHNLPAVLF